MADGPTVAQIIKKREADIKTCESTAQQQERVKREATMPSVVDYVKDLVLYGPSGRLSMDLFKIHSDERVCKAAAPVNADTSFALRENALDYAKKSAETDALGKGIVLAATEEANQRYRKALALCSDKPQLDFSHPRGPQFFLAKKS